MFVRGINSNPASHSLDDHSFDNFSPSLSPSAVPATPEIFVADRPDFFAVKAQKLRARFSQRPAQ
jgi:hypothetical protein